MLVDDKEVVKGRIEKTTRGVIELLAGIQYPTSAPAEG